MRYEDINKEVKVEVDEKLVENSFGYFWSFIAYIEGKYDFKMGDDVLEWIVKTEDGRKWHNRMVDKLGVGK